MLYGDLNYSKPATGPWIVRLPAEEANASRILLTVFQCRINEAPEDLTDHAQSVGMSSTVCCTISL